MWEAQTDSSPEKTGSLNSKNKNPSWDTNPHLTFKVTGASIQLADLGEKTASRIEAHQLSENIYLITHLLLKIFIVDIVCMKPLLQLQNCLKMLSKGISPRLSFLTSTNTYGDILIQL